MTDGKWTCSTNDERWDCGEEFDTREDALAFAISELAPDYGIEDGGSVFVGQINKVTIDNIAAGIFDADSVIDQMACWLYDNVGEDFVDDIKVSKEQSEDLEERLAATVREWATANGIEPTCFTLENVERHTWEQCDETREVDTDPSSEPPHTERCLRHSEHEGAHEWP